MKNLEIVHEEAINEIMELFDLVHIYVQSQGNTMWENGYPNREIFLDDLKKGSYILRDENTNKIIAYGYVPSSIEEEFFYETYDHNKVLELLKYVNCTNPNQITMARFMVHPDYQRQGIGRYFFNEIDKIYNHPLWLFAVMKLNVQGIRHWEKEGFTNYGDYDKWEFGEWSDTCVLFAGELKNRL